jgi:hypothetical protein
LLRAGTDLVSVACPCRDIPLIAFDIKGPAAEQIEFDMDVENRESKKKNARRGMVILFVVV